MENTSSTGFMSGTDVAVWRAIAASARTAVMALEPRELTVRHAQETLTEILAVERAAAAARVLLAKRVTEGDQWRHDGFASPAEWLAAQQGTSTGRARQDLDTSGRLHELDETTDALRHGRLSPEQAAAVSGAAAANPDAERDLLELAERESLRGLQDEAARRRAEREDQEERAKRLRRTRSCRTWTDNEGAWNLRARGPIADAAGFAADLERLIDRRFRQTRRDVPEGEWESRDQYAFDVLVGLGAAVSNTSPATSTGPAGTARHPAHPEPVAPTLFPDAVDATGAADTANATEQTAPPESASPDAPATTPSSAVRVRHLALLRVDLAALVRGSVTDGEVCEVAGFGPISVDEMRRLLGDSLVKIVLTNGVDVVNVAHAGRGPRIAQEIALLWAQPVCCVEGCTRTRRLEVDHGVGYAHTRLTELRDLWRPCEHHHDLKTFQGWDYGATGPPAGGRRVRLVPPDHPDHPGNRASRGGGDANERAAPGAA